MKEIKAIETVYKGYRFRSRLEARWAVFFDTLGVEWEYEPEGFDLSRLGWYLADFRVLGFGSPGLNYYEVKPRGCKEKIWVDKCKALAQLTETNVYLLEGPPDFTYYDKYDPKEQRCYCQSELLCKKDSVGNCSHIDLTVCFCYSRHGNDDEFYAEQGPDEEWFSDNYKKAVYASRAARF